MTTPTTPSAIPIRPEQVVNVVEVGSSDIPPFGFDERHKREGWKYRADNLWRVHDMNCKRTIFHNCHGHLGPNSYAFDMVPRLLEAGGIYRGLVDGFAPAMKPLVAMGHTLDVYLGPLGVEGMRTKVVNGRRVPLDLDDYLRRLATSLKPYVDAGVSRVYIDASALVRRYHTDYPALLMIENWFGSGLGIEARPVGNDTWDGWPVYSMDSHWEASGKLPGASPDKAFTDVVRTVNEYRDPDEKADRIRAILDAKHKPGLDVINAVGVFGGAA